MEITLDTVLNNLKRRMMPETLEGALSSLEFLYYRSITIATARNLRPERIEPYLQENPLIQDMNDLYRLINAVLFWVEDEVSFCEDEYYLMPVPYVPFSDFTWDTWDEFCNDLPEPEHMEKGNHGLEILYKFIDLGIDAELWEEANQKYGWGIPAPDFLNDSQCFNWKKMEPCFKAAGLDLFYKAFVVLAQNTENSYLDWESSAVWEGIIMPYDFNRENLELLTLAFIDAEQNWMPVFEEALRKSSPENLQKIVKALEESFRVDPPKTLAEIFAADDGETEELEEECSTTLNFTF
jgi:hypothetical protein